MSLRFILIIATSFFSFIPVHSATISEIEQALNKYTSLTADFKQYNADGSLSSGKFYLERPGRLKFIYDHPIGQLIMTKDDWLVLYDPKLKEGTYIELEHTPAHILLKNKISLTEGVEIQSIHEIQNTTYVSLTIQGHDITLLLKNGTLELLGWISFDMQGGRTQVLLEKHLWDTPIPEKTWHYTEPSKLQKRRA